MISRKVSLLIFCSSFLFLSFYFYHIPYTISVDRLIFIVGFIFFIYIVFFLTKDDVRVVKKQYLSLTFFFIIGYTIVFFQNYIDLLLGFTDWYHYLSITYPEAVCRSAVISLSGFICFCIGYLLYKDNYHEKGKLVRRYISLRALKFFTLIMFIIYMSSVGKSYFYGGYGEIEVTGFIGFIGYLFEALLYAVIVLYSLNCSSKDIKKLNFASYIKGLGWFNVILGLYLLMVLLSGDRGAIMYFILAYFYSYICYSKECITGKKVFLLILVGGFSITILGIARNVQNAKGNKLEQIDIALQMIGEKEKTSFFLPTKELANSVRTLHAVVEESENKSDFYFYGKYQLYQILSCLPFMGTLLVESGMYTDKSLISSRYITYLLQGSFPRYGDGTSCNADLYLDFGYWGVCFGLFLFGFFCRKTDIAECEERVTSLFFYILMIVYFSYCISLSRNPILYPLKKAVLVYLICVAYTYIVKHTPNINK